MDGNGTTMAGNCQPSLVMEQPDRNGQTKPSGDDCLHAEDPIRTCKELRKYVCTCGKVYKARGTLTIHLEPYQKDEDGKFKCEFCGKRFLKTSSLRSHLVATHGKDLPRKAAGCSWCGHIFRNFRHMSRHKRFGYCLEGSNEGKADLGTAGTSFQPAIAIKTEVGSGGEQIMNFESVSSSSTMTPTPIMGNPPSGSSQPSGNGQDEVAAAAAQQQHFRDPSKSANNDLQHFCICGQSFPKSSALSTHIRRQTEEWKFRCEHCPKAFFRMYQLRRHLLMIHHLDVGEGVGCAGCGKIFPTNRELSKHQRYGVCRPVKLVEAR